MSSDRPKTLELMPKKRPSQRRSKETFDALVDACARLLAERGYAKTTTNHVAERAGVGIASLYEYFPGKDAIVAQAAERLVERVLGRLAAGAADIFDAPADEAFRRWIELIYQTVKREKDLVAVFLYQVPYTHELAPIRALQTTLFEFSRNLERSAGGEVTNGVSRATLHLAINLVTSTIMQLLLDPPSDVTRADMLDELSRRLEAWARD